MLDVNLLKPSRLEFADESVPMLAMLDAHASSPQWLEYSYRKAHPALRWLPTKLAEWIGERTCRISWFFKFLLRPIRGQHLDLDGLLLSSTIFLMRMWWTEL